MAGSLRNKSSSTRELIHSGAHPLTQSPPAASLNPASEPRTADTGQPTQSYIGRATGRIARSNPSPTAPLNLGNCPDKQQDNTSLFPRPVSSSQARGVFNLLLQFSELVFEVAKHLDIEDLISLYAISKDFHRLANRHFTGLILSQSVAKAAESSRTFIHRCYKNLCMRDPAQRRLSGGNEGEIRWVPSFRWLRMILFREAVVDDILQSLFYEGHRLPKAASLVIKKMWFTLDISDNHRRIGLIHSEQFWTASDLFTIQMFMVKLDLRLTDPMSGSGETGLRSLLLNQRSLSTLARVLRREEMKTQLDLLRMIVRYNYTPPRPPINTILGVPPQEVGRLQYEGWGLGKRKFMPLDEMIVAESVRRGLGLGDYYIDMMLYGFIDKKTGRDVRTPKRPAQDIGERAAVQDVRDDDGGGGGEDEPQDDVSLADAEEI